MSNLIVVDDQQIRKTAFSRVDRLLKKLQRMESNLETFVERDQRLFNEWFNLTFRTPRMEMDRLRGEYRQLAEFHNWMHALAEMEDLSLPHAAVLLREEERLMRDGNDIDRAEVLRRRRLRDEYIANAHARESRRQEEPPTRSHAPDSADIDELEVVESLSDEELEDWCADENVAFVMVGKALRLATYTGNYQLFFRLWDVLHPNVQREFGKRFQKATGESLFDTIEEMRAKVQASSENPTEALHDTLDEESSGQEKRKRRDPKADAAETFKLIYRQLARKLHPDMHAKEAGKGPDWRAKMWLRVQAAYQEEDHEQMTRLFHLVLLRGKEFNDLRLSDLHQTHEYLAQEIGQTEEYIRTLRRTPAWGFSRRKDTKPIEHKLGKQLAKERQILEDQVSELRVRHAFLERMGRTDTARGRQRRRRG